MAINISFVNCKTAIKYKDKFSNLIYDSNHHANYTESYSHEEANEKCAEMIDYIEKGKATVLGAFDGEVLIGMLWSYVYPFREDTNRLYISIVHIDEKYRGKKIGSQMFDIIENYARQKGYRCIFLHAEGDNAQARGFYKHCGFEEERVQLVLDMSKHPKNVNLDITSRGGEIRNATFNDIKYHFEEFAELFLRNEKAHLYTDSMNISDAKYEMELLEYYLTEGKANIYYFRESEKIVGFIWLFPIDYHGKKRFHVKALTVDEEYTGRGLARQLLQQMKNNLRSEDVVYTFCDYVNKGAIYVHKSVGFVEEGMQYVKII